MNARTATYRDPDAQAARRARAIEVARAWAHSAKTSVLICAMTNPSAAGPTMQTPRGTPYVWLEDTAIALRDLREAVVTEIDRRLPVPEGDRNT